MDRGDGLRVLEDLLRCVHHVSVHASTLSPVYTPSAIANLRGGFALASMDRGDGLRVLEDLLRCVRHVYERQILRLEASGWRAFRLACLNGAPLHGANSWIRLGPAAVRLSLMR